MKKEPGWVGWVVVEFPEKCQSHDPTAVVIVIFIVIVPALVPLAPKLYPVKSHRVGTSGKAALVTQLLNC